LLFSYHYAARLAVKAAAPAFRAEKENDMALFKRPDLKAQGLTDEQIDYIMTEANRSLSKNYVLTSDVQGQIDAARADWEKGQTVPDPTQSEAYKALQGDFTAYKQMQEARGSKDYEGVKPKFFETVYNLVDRGDGAEPVEKQLAGIREKYEEYFTTAQQQTKPPVFGAPVEGSMPKGDKGAVDAVTAAWGFGPKK
jgi:hypothetical protein